MKDFYTEGIAERKVVNRETYKGRGRPRKTDYCTLLYAQNWINKMILNMIDNRFIRTTLG